MQILLGTKEERTATPVYKGERVVDLIPGRIRSYLMLKLFGRAFRLRVPSWVLPLAS